VNDGWRSNTAMGSQYGAEMSQLSRGPERALGRTRDGSRLRDDVSWRARACLRKPDWRTRESIQSTWFLLPGGLAGGWRRPACRRPAIAFMEGIACVLGMGPQTALGFRAAKRLDAGDEDACGTSCRKAAGQRTVRRENFSDSIRDHRGRIRIWKAGTVTAAMARQGPVAGASARARICMSTRRRRRSRKVRAVRHRKARSPSNMSDRDPDWQIPAASAG